MSHYTDIVRDIPHGQEVKSTWLHKHGGLVLSPDEGAALEALFASTHGDHVDIGTYFAGSAILAALSKPDGLVYTIDCQTGGHWDQGIVTVKKINANLACFGVSDRIMLVCANSHPWPLPDVHPATVFIDGDEDDQAESGGVLHDWLNVKDITTGYIIFHDCRSCYPGVVRTVGLAEKDMAWELAEAIDSVRIFKRRLAI